MTRPTGRSFLPSGPQANPLRIAAVGVMVALIGAVLGVVGFAAGQRWLWFAGFVIGLTGWAVGTVGILYGLGTGGTRALIEGFRGALGTLRRFWSYVLRKG